MKFYQEINTSEELPEEGGRFLCSQKSGTYILMSYFIHNNMWMRGLFPMSPKSWLKHLPFEELMIGFAEWCEEKCGRMSKKWFLLSENEPYELFTTSELLKKYCELKGIKIK